MSLQSFIQAMPKAELHVQLEGAFQQPTLLMIAEQNDIYETLKHYNDWVALIAEPDYTRLNEIVRMVASWLKIPENLTLLVYELGTGLAKQNVAYAEVGVNLWLYPDMNLSFDDFLAALNDGRDRAQRAWGIDMAWVIDIAREEPRRADDIARWVSTAAARRANVVALGLNGEEKTQAAGQFERAFRAVEKKDLPRVVRAGDDLGAEGVLKAIEALNPNRILDARGVAESPEAIKQMVDNNITAAINLTRAKCQGWVETIADYPLRALYDADVSLVLGSDLPSLYHTTLNDEYIAAVEQGGLSLEELENIALNAVRTSFLAEDAKTEMLNQFTQAYVDLRAEHIEAETEKP